MWRLVGPVLALILCDCGRSKPAALQQKESAPSESIQRESLPVTHVEMHNVLLHEDPVITLRVRWLRGRLIPARKGVIASFDDTRSFMIEIDEGSIATSASDLTTLLDQRVFAYAGSPLSNVQVSMQDTQIKLNGTLHKGISMPIEMLGDVVLSPQGSIRVHAAKLRALHVPVKRIMGTFGITVADLIDPRGAKGISVEGNDVSLDLEQMLPPPQQRGHLTDVHVHGNDLVLTFGSPRQDVKTAGQWRNYISFEGGRLQFGKLTMRDADLVMIDTSNDAWFDFYLDRYQEQLVAGYSKITSKAGLRIFMPDFNKLTKAPAAP